MSVICVDKDSSAFQDMAKNLDVHPDSLETIWHSFINNEKREPSEVEIKEILRGKPWEANEVALNYWLDAKLNSPRTFGNFQAALDYYQDLKSKLPNSALSMYRNNNGNYVVSVGTPILEGLSIAFDDSLIDRALNSSNTNPTTKVLKGLIHLLGKDYFHVQTRIVSTSETTMKDNPRRKDNENTAVWHNKEKIVSFNPIAFKNLVKIYENYFSRNGERTLSAKEKRYIQTKAVERIFAHELTHALSMKILDTPDEQLTQRELKFKQEINALYKEAFEHYTATHKDYETSLPYGLEDVREFISEAISNHDFQRYLASVRSNVDTGSNLWQRLIRIFKNILGKFANTQGIDRDTLFHSVLANTLLATSDLINNYKSITKEKQSLEEKNKKEADDYWESVEHEEIPEDLFTPSIVPKVELEDQYSRLVQKHRMSTSSYKFSQKQLSEGMWRFFNIPNNVSISDAVKKGKEILEKEGLDPNDFIFDREGYHYDKGVLTKRRYIKIRLKSERERKKEFNSQKEEEEERRQEEEYYNRHDPYTKKERDFLINLRSANPVNYEAVKDGRISLEQAMELERNGELLPFVPDNSFFEDMGYDEELERERSEEPIDENGQRQIELLEQERTIKEEISNIDKRIEQEKGAVKLGTIFGDITLIKTRDGVLYMEAGNSLFNKLSSKVDFNEKSRILDSALIFPTRLLVQSNFQKEHNPIRRNYRNIAYSILDGLSLKGYSFVYDYTQAYEGPSPGVEGRIIKDNSVQERIAQIEEIYGKGASEFFYHTIEEVLPTKGGGKQITHKWALDIEGFKEYLKSKYNPRAEYSLIRAMDAPVPPVDTELISILQKIKKAKELEIKRLTEERLKLAEEARAARISSNTLTTDIIGSEDELPFSQNTEQSSQVKLKSKNTWQELVEDMPALEQIEGEQLNQILEKLEQYISEESTRALHPSTYTNYFDEVNNYGYSFKTAGELVASIAQNSLDEDTRNLASFIQKYLNERASKVNVTYSNKSSKTERGWYVDGEIMIFKNAASGRNPNEARVNFERVILHEIVHAITVDYLSTNLAARKEVASIMNQLKNAAQKEGSPLKLYSLKNTKEFVAEFMSKPTLREAMKLIPYQGKKENISTFKKILNVIKNAFLKLIGRSKVPPSLYDKAMESLTKIMEESYNYKSSIIDNNVYKSEVPQVEWARTAPNSYEVSTQGDKRFSALNARFKPGTIIDGVDVSGMTIENVYQSVIKKSGKGKAPSKDSKLYNESLTTNEEREDFSYREGYLPLWQEWARQNPELMQELREKSAGKVLTDKFASTRVSQARALAEILNSESSVTENIETQKPTAETTTEKIDLQNTTNQEQQSQQPINKENQSFMEQQQLIIEQIDALLDHPLLSATEVRYVAEQVAYWISDHITEIQTNPEKAVKIYGEKFKNKDFSTMSRADVVRTITPDAIIEMCQAKFDPENADFENRSTIRKARAITDNWKAIILLSQDVLLTVEGFSIVSSRDGKTSDVNENIIGDVTLDIMSNSEADVKEEEGNLQEHWQIETKTLDVIATMSQMIKAALIKCYKLDKEGNKITSEFGINERINLRNAVNSILRWTQGANTLEEMMNMLQEKSESNPWITQILERLNPENKDTDLQSQFFSTFCKHFQTYSIIIKEGNTFKSITVNKNPALRQAVNNVKSLYQMAEHPLFTTEGVNTKTFEDLKNQREELNEWSNLKYDFTNEETKNAIATDLGYIANLLGYHVSPEIVASNLTRETFANMKDALDRIICTLNQHKEDSMYNPFDFKIGITGNLKAFLRPITEVLEDTAITAFYDSGKMYQSYITPSYTTKLFNKFHSKGEAFEKFINEEYGQYSWFKEGGSLETGWRNEWLRMLVNSDEARKVFQHKVQLNFNKHSYMKEMSDVEYALSIITEYFSENSSENQSLVPAWFRVAMLSNKPSAEYIRFYSYRGSDYKDLITDGFIKIFGQELSRIQTVKLRNYDKTDPRFIKNFDKNGKKFMFLDFMNEYLTGSKKDTELGKLINDKLEGKAIDTFKLEELAGIAIKEAMEAKVENILIDWKKQGIVEGAMKVQNVGKTKEAVLKSLENFIWNDTFASMNILQLTITDIAFYKDAEDLQKRLAQIHAPGIRANIAATDYKGIPVSDGKFRTIKLKDFDSFISNIIDNVSEVFDRKIAAAPETEKPALRALKESLVREEIKDKDGKIIQEAGAFRRINVADAQGYSSITSYRKKALLFGKWSKDAETVYNKLKNGEKVNYSDLQVAFQPLKPFVYSQLTKNSGVTNPAGQEGIMETLKTPVQYKNSEYLLIMADALLRGEETGRPNILRAISEVMEESHFEEDGKTYRTKGIDTIQFESTTKSGLSGAINLNDLLNNPKGETIAKARLEAAIYNEDRTYNLDTVDEAAMEDYCLQQEVPEHFKDHSQVHGSQLRYIIISELESLDAKGEAVKYNLDGKEVTAEEFKAEYEKTIAENIQQSINDLADELSLNTGSIKDRNIALSRILQKEILSSPRYGVDLLQACSVDKNGQFRIPLGDPVQSKRVEQLINSVIKNRINKQKIAGGPVVQVSNFGTSKELNIRFKDKNGNLLKTRSEFKGTEEEYRTYIKENQAGIAYFECYAPIYANELFEKFADENGTISVETIEMIDPELLKMIGYRIPTEDKYSAIPLKIVGFLPREAGDGIMLPYDITLLNGSDFDIDKMYLMRKELSISTRFTSKSDETMSESELKYVNKHRRELENYLRESINLQDKISKEEATEISAKVKDRFDVDRRRAEEVYQEELNKIDQRISQLEEANDEAEVTDNQYEKLEKKKDRNETYWKDKAKKRYDLELEKIQDRETTEFNKEVEKLKKEKVYRKIKTFLSIDRKQSPRLDDTLTSEIRRAYINYMYHTVAPADNSRAGRNNKIVDMTYEVLTHSTSVDKILNPGGFEPQKKMGYMIEAYRKTDKSWSELQNMEIEDLKDLISTDKNLNYIDTHLQFYKQNNAAGSLIGVFAVNRTAHAVLESNSNDKEGTAAYQVDVEAACKLTNPFTVAGIEFGGMMPFDMRYDRNHQLIGKVLGSLVASAADAVKDPVLNLMNINSTTANILTSLVRMGMPFEDAALFLSQSVISEVLLEFSKENVIRKKSLNKIIKERLDKIKQDYNIDETSPINQEELTKEELIKGIKSASHEVQYKTLVAFSNFQKIAAALRMPTFATRFNSISSAVGPLIIDNLATEYQMQKLSENSFIVDANGDAIDMREIFDKHPIISKFSQSLSIARDLFSNMPANSNGFRNILNTVADTALGDTLFSKNGRKLLLSLSDFYQSYLLVANGVIDNSKLNYYISSFPKEFSDKKYKEKYKDNALIQAIKFGIDKSGRNTLKIDITGLDTQAKEMLGNAWIDLYKQDKDLAIQLFEYNFFRTGIGFSPKTFLNLLPTYIKERIPGYVDTYRILPATNPELVLDQFVRNYWEDKLLVPYKKVNMPEGSLITITDKETMEELTHALYFKVSANNGDRVFKITSTTNDSITCRELSTLGSNRDYLEISTAEIDKPIEIKKTENPNTETTESDSEIKEPNDTAAEEEVTDTTSSEEKITELLFKILMTEQRDKKGAEEYIKNHKAKSEKEKERLMKPMKSFIENRFKVLGIELNTELIDKLYKEFC